MSTWEERMSQKAQARLKQRWDKEAQKVEDEQSQYMKDHPDEVMHFEGTCDVCGDPISLDWHWKFGIIDYGFDNEVMFTWMRHYATAPAGANPNCAIYSSRIYLVDKVAPGMYGE